MATVAVREPALVAGSMADSESWIVCRGTTRDVIDGKVACPFKGPIELEVCADCHLLETLPGEWRRWSCGAQER